MIKPLFLGLCCASTVVATMAFGETFVSQALGGKADAKAGVQESRSVQTPLLPMPLLNGGRSEAMLFLRVAIMFQPGASVPPDELVAAILSDAAYDIVMSGKFERNGEAQIVAASLRRELSDVMAQHVSGALHILIDQMNIRTLEVVR